MLIYINADQFQLIMTKIKVFDSTDENLKKLGELLSNDTSRKIMKALIDNEMYTNEIALKLDIRVSLVIHHLKKLESLGLVVVTEKQLIRKGKDHRFFRMISNLYITPSITNKELEEKGVLKKLFAEGVKFTSVISAGLLSYFSTLHTNVKSTASQDIDFSTSTNLPSNTTLSTNHESIIIALVVALIGVVILYFLKK